VVSLKEIEEKGVSIDEIDGLQENLNEKTAYQMIAGIQLQRQSGARSEPRAADADSSGSEVITIPLDGHGSDNLEINVKVSGDFIRQMIVGMVLNFIAVIAIIFVITAESMRLPQMLDFRKSGEFNRDGPLQYKQVAYTLRFGNFITSVGSYSCLAFSALMIRQWNQGAFGLSVGLTAALSISLCSLAKVVGLLAAPAFARKLETRRLLTVSTALLICANLACFFTASSATVLLLRTLSGLGFAGNKQALNSMIALGYGTSKEREENLAESNAGLIGGIMCGSAMGAIIAATLGYEATFALASGIFVLFIVFLIYFIPWKLLAENAGRRENGEVDFRRVFALMKDPQVVKYSLTVNLPVYIYLMVIVVLIPGIIQSGGIPPVVLTYCNLLNGLAGLYIGVRLGGLLRSRIGIRTSIVLVCAIGSAAVLMQALSFTVASLPLTIAALIFGAALLGLVDGAGVPLTSDYFLELDSIRGRIDEATALSLLSIIGFIVMTVAPVILDICITSRTALIIVSVVLFVLNLFIYSKKEKTYEKGI
jgi:predicted MFS family arabinose efflux permease